MSLEIFLRPIRQGGEVVVEEGGESTHYLYSSVAKTAFSLQQ